MDLLQYFTFDMFCYRSHEVRGYTVADTRNNLFSPAEKRIK